MSDPTEGPGTYYVTYCVTYACSMKVAPGEDFQDSISDIDIPEGGKNGSIYSPNTFQITGWTREEEA